MKLYCGFSQNLLGRETDVIYLVSRGEGESSTSKNLQLNKSRISSIILNVFIISQRFHDDKAYFN